MGFMGEGVALATVICWTLSVQFFESASKRVGPTAVNIIRIISAFLLFTLYFGVRGKELVPLSFPADAWLYLGLSGGIGLFIGDIFLFKALVELGPRVTMLIQSLATPTAAIIGWIFLDEMYSASQWFGMFVALSGVSLVVLERVPVESRAKRQVRRISLVGVVYGFLAMLGQGGGLVLSKFGMQTESGYLDAFAATQIRVIAALVCFVLFFSFTGRWSHLREALRDRVAVGLTVTGAAFGPFLGVSLALLSLHYLSTGVASTFFALIPICIIPFSVYLHNEHVSARAVCGACIAVAGVAVLVMS
jgi:drug/metabolite transporter (DMT)-like permease